MALIKTVRGWTPQFGKDCWLAENATVTGDVIMGEECSVWFQAVLRGDVGKIRIGNRVNVQDGVVVHSTYEKTDTIIGNDVSIGHRAIVHGCTIHDNVLIGMGAIVMDNVVVESYSLIAAGAVVRVGTRVERGSIYAGVPARRIKTLSAVQYKEMLEGVAEKYLMYANWYK